LEAAARVRNGWRLRELKFAAPTSPQPLMPFFAMAGCLCLVQIVILTIAGTWPDARVWLILPSLLVSCVHLVLVMGAIAVCNRRARWLLATLPVGVPIIGAIAGYIILAIVALPACYMFDQCI
jgi:hypothetical protein